MGIKAGWGQADITPKGGPISLRGQFHTRITTEILDPLNAVALALEQDGKRFIVVSVDLCSPSEQLSIDAANIIKERMPDFDDRAFVLCATHIHTGPFLARGGMLSLTGVQKEDEGTIPSAECRRQVAEGIAKAVELAVADLRESEIELAVAQIITGVNRRTAYKDGTARMYGPVAGDDFLKMEGRDGGPTQLLYVYDAKDHRLTGVLADVPCTAQCDENANYVTADYWGVTRERVGKELGADVKVLALCRAAGDLSPHPMVDRIAGREKMNSGRECAVWMGEWVAENIISHKNKTFRKYAGDVALKTACADIDFPVWPVSEEEAAAAAAYIADKGNFNEDGSPKDKFEYANCWTRAKRVREGIWGLHSRMYAARLGDIAFITYPFELYIEYADRVRVRNPQLVVFDAELAYASLGYLATPNAVKGGHYSANIFNGVCSPAGGEVLVEKGLELIKEVSE